MSGWDVSSTPTWGSQEPEETQAYSADGSGEYGQNFSAPGTGGGYSGGNMAGGPPSEFFGQEQSEGAYPRRTPGQSFQDLPRRGGAAAGGGYGQDNGDAFGQDWRGGGEDETMKWGSGGGQDAGYGQDWGGQGSGDSWGQQDNFGGSGGGYGQDSGFGGQEYGSYGGRGGGLPAQNDPALQDFFGSSQGGQSAGGGFGDQRGGWSGGGDSARDAFNAGGNDDVDWTGRPKNRGAAATADADVDWTGRPKNRGAAASGDGDVDWTGKPRGSRPSRDEEDDIRGGMGPKALIAVGVVVLVIVLAGAYIVLKPKHNTSAGASSSTTATANGLAGSSPAAKAKASTGAGGTTAAAAFTLLATAPASLTVSGATLSDTPANPNDLKIGETTAGDVVAELSSKGAGTAKSTTPTVAQAYNLTGGQAMTVVGYEGTFTPTKVSAVLAGLGTNSATFKPGPDGGILGCANTPTAPQGAVCVWSTTSTVGITEFFGATAPETITSQTGQFAIANDTLAAQAAIEKKA